jgi:LacI family transcriptional regulator
LNVDISVNVNNNYFERGNIATIKDIARRANVSIGTVDRVLHERGHVSKKTEERVRRIIEELDYKPNIFAKQLKLARTFTFGILMPRPSQDSNYWTLPIKGINNALNELAAQKIAVRYFFYDKYSESSFNNVSIDLLEANLDGLLIAPVLSKVFDKFIREIPDDKPYVFFDSFIPNANYVSYIGQDSFQSGVLSGRLMHMLIRTEGNVAVIKVLPEDYHINDRVSGFLSYFDNCPNISIKVYELDTGISVDVRNQMFKKIISDNDNLHGIFVTNATTHQVAEYVKSQLLQKRIHIIGYDLIEDNIKLLKSGVIDFLISQQSENQGYEGLYVLYRHVVLKQKVEKKVLMQLDIVTKENIDYYHS